MSVRGVRCGLSNHKLDKDAVLVTNKYHLAFIRMRIKHFRDDDLVCRDCYEGVITAYKEKSHRAVALLNARKRVSIQSSQSCAQESSSSDATTSKSASTVIHIPIPESSENITTDDDEFAPSPNALGNVRLPNVQPIPKRRQFTHPDPRVMDIYLAGTTGG